MLTNLAATTLVADRRHRFEQAAELKRLVREARRLRAGDPRSTSAWRRWTATVRRRVGPRTQSSPVPMPIPPA